MFNSWSIAHRSFARWVLYFPENLIETLEPAALRLEYPVLQSTVLKDPDCRRALTLHAMDRLTLSAYNWAA